MRNDSDLNKLGAQLRWYRVIFHQGRKVVSGIFGSHEVGPLRSF